MHDALGVVEAVDPEENHFGVIQLGPELAGTRQDLVLTSEFLPAVGVDRDWKGAGPAEPPTTRALALFRHLDHRSTGGRSGQLATRPQEVGGVITSLKADQVRPEQTLDDLSPPGEPGVNLKSRKRNVIEEPDTQIGTPGSQQAGHQLELVVLHPDHRGRGRLFRHHIREPPIDVAVGLPPATLELRDCGQVVIERPEGGIGEALVVFAHVLGAQLHRPQAHAFGFEGVRFLVRGTRPAHPGPLVAMHDRGQGRHQAARTYPPRRRAVGVADRLDR